MGKTMGIQSSVRELVKQLLATRIWFAIVPVILLLVTLPIRYAQAFSPHEIVPYFGIVLGLVLNMIGVMIQETEYSVCGGWMILSGAADCLSSPFHSYRVCGYSGSGMLLVCHCEQYPQKNLGVQ